jgi:hypothetical protein
MARRPAANRSLADSVKSCTKEGYGVRRFFRSPAIR